MWHIWPLIAAIWLLLLFIERSLAYFQHVSIERSMNDILYLGQTTNILYRVMNQSSHPVRLRLMEHLGTHFDIPSISLEWNLSGRDSLTLPVQLRSTTIGNVVLKNISASVLGRLSLAWWDHHFQIEAAARVIPDFRSPGLSHQLYPRCKSQKLPLHLHNAITLVINADEHNQLEVKGLRRSDSYLNHAMSVARQAFRAHRPVNILVYAHEILIELQGLRHLKELRKFWSRLDDLNKLECLTADHRVILKHVDHSPGNGLLIWYTDLDGAVQSSQLADITQLLKRRYSVILFNMIATETALLEQDILENCRSPYHRLAVMDKKHQWAMAKGVLQRAGNHIISV
jgi:uncharacterized protein (DUF58 family)